MEGDEGEVEDASALDALEIEEAEEIAESERFATRSRGMHRGFASQLCGICEKKKVHAVKRMADKRMARLAEQQLIRRWLA